jgi:homoserine kinase
MARPKSRVTVESPATIANFGPGYDTFGMCLDGPVDTMVVERSKKPGIQIEVLKGGFKVPVDPARNTASVAAQSILSACGSASKSVGLKINILKKIRPGSGLGSSAASAVGGALGAAAILGFDDLREILRAASIGEGASSGAPHLDNVSPCLFGGFTSIVNPAEYDVLQIEPLDMSIVVCLPDIVIETARARKLIPKQLPLGSAIAHVGWASGLIVGLNNGDLDLMAACMQDDIAVPARRVLIKGYDRVRRAALDAGALSFSISGSGPAVFSLSKAKHDSIGKAMVKGFSKAGVTSDYFIAKPGTGAKIK